MQLIKNIFNFYINSSLHVAFAVVSLVVITFLEYDVSVNISLLLYVLFGTLTGYNFVKYAGIAKLYHLSLAKNLRNIQIFSLLVFLGLIVQLIQQSLNVIIVSLIMGLLTLLYALPLFQADNNLRSIPGLKIFVIAFVWAGVTVLLPLIDTHSLTNLDVIITFFQRFSLTIALIMPFEIRDLKFDDKQLRTLPQKFGVRGAKIIGQLFLIAMVLIEFLKEDISAENAVSLVIIAAITLGMIVLSTINQNKYYASFWIEGIPILWLGIILLLS